MHDSLEQIEGRKQMGEEVIIEGVGENFKRSQKIREGDLDGKFRKAHTLGGNLEFYIWNHETEMPSKEGRTEKFTLLQVGIVKSFSFSLLGI